MKIKDTKVRPTGMRVELLLALTIADKIWERHGQDLVLTSLNDGGHSTKSLHYSGCAADLRIWGIKDVQGRVEEVAAELREALGGDDSDYDVVVESNHIHLEYQPRRHN